MRKIIIFSSLCLTLGLLLGILVQRDFLSRPSKNKIIQKIIDRSLDKYTVDNLTNANIPASDITREKTLKEDPFFTSYLFSYNFDPSLSNSQKKKVSGVLNVPNIKNQKFPIIVMVRGYIEPSKYTSGEGTEHGSEEFVKNRFITVAPDFLGYGESDKEPDNVFEARFQTYTTVLTLLKSLQSIPEWDGKNVFLWGHSNGGQIVLTILEITKGNYPTVLWAPVSKPFPYSILYYTDDSQDLGRELRRRLSDFESVYDANLYSVQNYLDRIKAPVELHQGTADDAVPVVWSDSLYKKLKEDKVDIKYFTYPGSDHNLMPAWNTVVARNIAFFNNHL